jgi:hypothetical protein
MTSTPTPQVEEIASKLTKAQRDALIAAVECKGGEWWTAYAGNVRDSSLAYSGTLTLLGLEVRAHLLKQGCAG